MDDTTVAVTFPCGEKRGANNSMDLISLSLNVKIDDL